MLFPNLNSSHFYNRNPSVKGDISPLQLKINLVVYMNLRISHYLTWSLSFPFSFKQHRFACCSLTALLSLENYVMNRLAKRQC